MNKDIELLAPAGSYDAFLAGISNGANAIYLGLKNFNARASASNFELDELKEMVKYAHLRGVKLYITLNTLLNNDELKEALEVAYNLYEINIDGVIVQDLGLAKIFHEYIPDLELHASTQMTIYNLNGVNELQKIGFKRVVLARELSLEEIKYICDNTSLEIEIFVHGALCVSYSGECLMSSMIGGRSGNRGKCAQACRLPYTLLENDKEVSKGYLLSPKDLMTLELLPNIPNVKSLKIEGRMKSPEYVASTVKTYRKYIDMLLSSNNFSIDENDKKEIAQIFNRGGFTTAYLEKKQGHDMMCYEKPKNLGLYVGKVLSYDNKRYIEVSNSDVLNIGDGIEIMNGELISPSTIISEIHGNKIGRIHGNIRVNDKVYKTSDKNLMKSLRETYERNSTRKTLINMKIKIKSSTPILFNINGVTYETDVMPDIAKNMPISKDKIIEQISKTGDTPFKINKLEIDMDDNLFLPVSTINSLRRDALKYYENFLLKKEIKEIEKKDLQVPTKNIVKMPISCTLCVNKLENELLNIKNVSSIYVPIKEVILNKELFCKLPFKKYILLPTITKNNYDRLIRKNVEMLSRLCDGFVLSNIGQLGFFSNINTELISNYTFNVFNDYTIKYLKDIGFSKITLSPELSKNKINSLFNNENTELIVYGRMCLMTSEYCPIRIYNAVILEVIQNVVNLVLMEINII